MLIQRPEACALALFALTVAAPAAASASAIADPSCGEMRVVMRENAVVYALPHGFLRAGTDSVWSRAGSWRPGSDYVLERLRGELRLLRPPIPGDTLRVRGCWLLAPPPLELSLMRYRPAAGAARESLAGAGGGPDARGAAVVGGSRPAAARDPARSPAGASLTLTGNKTIAVDFGSNQDAFLRQSLDLAVSGTLAPGIEITGVLSDRNTPLTAGGSTQSLEALDRVLIELKAPQGSAALGDIGLDLRQGEFARLERRLQGVRGEWSARGFSGGVAAASAPGKYHRMQFFGVEGRQGPYLLTDRDGGAGISVVAASEIVTVDGLRMMRGESADYSIDYERARITFSNRRPITSASRVTVDYQYSVNRFRRNLLAAGGRWERGGRFAFVQGLTEADDRGRPLDIALSASDLLLLRAAGDSASRAIGAGIVPGAGDYDTVRVDPSRVVFAYAGRDSGTFSVEFTRVGAGLGDYADSSVVGGRTLYRFTGEGMGAYRVGRALPLPESHQLWAMGAGMRAGSLAVELEGAVSRLDRNTFSPLDDADARGEAGRATLKLEGGLPGPLAGTAGLALEARAVGQRFAPFSRLERPFAEEDWGLPLTADLEHQRRVGLVGFLRPRFGGELRASLGRLRLPDGFASLRRTLEWSHDGRVSTHARLERSDTEQEGRAFRDGGRERLRGDIRWRFRWVEPMLRAESDEGRTPSDTGSVGARFREAGVELVSGRALPWRLAGGYVVRRDARLGGTGFVDQSDARTVRIGLDSPPQGRLGVGLSYQRRDLEPLADVRRSRSDLGSVRLRGEDPKRGLDGRFNLEITSEGENRRARELRYVGPGGGAYDAFGNYIGVGDHDLVVTVGTELDRVARAATSALLGWQFGGSEAWRGSRLAFDFESEARRHGDLRAGDPIVSPGSVQGDPGLARGSVLQRLEAELAPGSRAAALRLRAERRVSADRSYENFAQTLDERALTARWRTRPAATVSVEVEGRLRRQSAGQFVTGGGAFRRVLLESGGNAQVVYTPDARLRAAGVLELTLGRPESQSVSTRTIRIGPNVGLAVGARARAEVSARRGFTSGPPAVGLLPTAEPAGLPTWESSARLDYRVRSSGTLGLSFSGRDRRGRTPLYTGRAELRAFF